MLNIVIGIVVFAIAGSVFLYALSMNRISGRLPVYTTRSRVLSRRTEKTRTAAMSPVNVDYYIIFEIDGKGVEMKVPKKKLYESLVLGQEGILTYQKKRFSTLVADFKKDA